MSGSAEMELVSRGRLKPRTLALSTIGIAGWAALGWLFLGPVVQRLTVWKPTTCTVLATSIDEKDDSVSYSSGGDDRGRGATKHNVHYKVYAPLVTFEYQADGQSFRCASFDALRTGQLCPPVLETERTSASALAAADAYGEPEYLERMLAIPPKYSKTKVESILAGFRPGTEVPCWYNPAEPRQAALLRRIEWYHVAVFGFLALGVAGFLADLYVSSRPQYRVTPVYTVPLQAKAHLGTKSRGLAFLGLGAIVLFISVFVYLVSFMWLVGDWPIMMTLIVLPFALLAVVCVGSAIFDLLTLRVGGVSAEFETGELKPRDLVRARLVQRGPANLRMFNARLCATKKESRKTGKGKTAVKEVTVHEQDLFESRSVRLGPSQYTDELFDVPIPELPFDGRLQWHLVVRRRMRIFPMLNETFPLPMRRRER